MPGRFIVVSGCFIVIPGDGRVSTTSRPHERRGWSAFADCDEWATVVTDGRIAIAASDPPAIAAGLARVRARIAAATRAAGRGADDVTLVAVSKTHSTAVIAAAVAAGQTVFGENRVQEAAAKFSPLIAAPIPPLTAGHPALRLHLIGALQTNKAREAVRLAHAIESLDRPRLADAIADAAEREGRLPDLYVQVNVGDEAQKAGVSRAEADAFIRLCRARFGAALRGLMCIPPAEGDPAPHFAWLAACAAEHGLAELSMGMSADFETAIGCGATLVRVGSAIFGARTATPACG